MQRFPFALRPLVTTLTSLAALLAATGDPSLAQADMYPVSRFAVFGDHGVYSASNPVNGIGVNATNDVPVNVANRIASFNPEYIVGLSDNIYQLPANTIADWDRATGDRYHQYIKYQSNMSAFSGGGSSQYFATNPAQNNFYPSLGNHDIDPDGIDADHPTGIAGRYTSYFNLPAGQGAERYYDFTRGTAGNSNLVHWFVTSSEPNEPDGRSVGSTQYKWLQGTTGVLTTSTSKWNLVVTTKTPYTSGSHGDQTVLQWGYNGTAGLGPGGSTVKSNAVFAGDDHDYERMTSPDGKTYFVNGLGGQSTTGIGSGGAATTQFPVPPTGSTHAIYNATHGFQIVRASDRAINYAFYTENGNKLDSLSQTQPGNTLMPRTFRNGDANGYTGAHDAELNQSASTPGNNATLKVAASTSGNTSQSLVRFDDIFGNGANQIPSNAEIVSATLKINVTTAGSGFVVRALASPFSDAGSNQWADWYGGDGVQAGGGESDPNYDETVGALSGTLGTTTQLNVGTGTFKVDVTTSVQNWAVGSPLYGWVLQDLALNGANPLVFSSSDNGTASLRPELSIEYLMPVPEPSTAFLLMTGGAVAAATCWLRRPRLAAAADHGSL